MWIVLGLSSLAVADEVPGSSVQIDVYNGEKEAWNLALSEADDHLWVAVEWSWVPDPAPTEHGMDLIRYEPASGIHVTRLVQPETWLEDEGMYPSITAWDDSGTVVMASKENWLQAQGRVHIWNVPKWTLGAMLHGPATSLNPTRGHGKPHVMDESSVTLEQYLSLTENGGGADDVMSKAKDAPSWLSSLDHPITASAGDVQDHSHQAFHADGTRYLVHHDDAIGTVCGESSCVDGVDNDGDGLVDESEDNIRLVIETYDPATQTWASVADVLLPGSAGSDFPTVWAHDLGAGASYITVSADSNTFGGGMVWRCSGTVADCDSAAEFGTGPELPFPGLPLADPKAFALEDSSGLVHEFLIYEEQGVPTPNVRIAANCEDPVLGRTGFVDQGPLPGKATTYESRLGKVVSSSQSQVAWDGSQFWVSFLWEQFVGSDTFEPWLYTASIADFCP